MRGVLLDVNETLLDLDGLQPAFDRLGIPDGRGLNVRQGTDERQDFVYTNTPVIAVVPTPRWRWSFRSSGPGLDSNSSEETARMNTTTDRTLATVLGLLPALVISVSSALADNTPMGGGMMGNGSTYGHMYGFNSAWLIALVVVVLGVVLVAVLRKTK